MGEATTGEDEIDYDNPPFPLTSIDRGLLAMRDEDFHRITWGDLKHIIANNQLEELKRLPSDLRRYLAWSHRIKQQYGGITNFVIQERLQWKPISEEGTPLFEHHSDIPFADPRDYAVLVNDWPYGFEEGIIHLLVWTKTRIAVDDVRGDVTPESRELIVKFVERFFVDDLEGGWGQVMWFKNWVSLQSVRGVDHVHVLVRDVPDEVMKRWMERKDL
ncbi:uncharacterized protein LTR77_005181 [Saxophila tyrrhenica]|uniref:N-acetylglucosamine-induced protein 1 n=1 Tax=Saxophila tyrrhenica TaxID=1690608 RepID=A0AAV9PBA5_9PEZI|nr:hypothetical protein LTR77_005181 [Saxophila tyrrhenica]